MIVLTIFQLIGMTAACIVLFFGLPAIALRPYVSGRRLTERFLICFAAGNGYMILLVFFLLLCRMADFFTLLAGILLPVFFLRRKDFPFLKEKAGALVEQFRRLIRGTFGAKSFWRWFFASIGKGIKHYFFDPIGRAAKRNKADTIFFLVLIGLTALLFGSRALTVYGYSASDTLLCNTRINAMDSGAFFPDGPYPFGFPAILFALHRLFGIRIFTLMRLFYFVTALLTVSSVYAFARLFFRRPYIPFGLGAALVFFARFTSNRFLNELFCTLPGPYGLLFLLPAIWFSLPFLKNVREKHRKTAAEGEAAEGTENAEGKGAEGKGAEAEDAEGKGAEEKGAEAEDAEGKGAEEEAAETGRRKRRQLPQVFTGEVSRRPLWGLGVSLALVLVIWPYSNTVVQPLEQNGAVACLTRILRTEKTSWTVVSAGDEGAMIHDEGGHYEINDFLSAMENYSSAVRLYIGTEDVYFFIEKRPMQYGEGLQAAPLQEAISAADAEEAVDFSAGYENYRGSARRTLMARMYYWAETYREMFPESCSVCYEDEGFICYRIRQNPDRLHNLAINYGYNK